MGTARQSQLKFTFNGAPFTAIEGETIAAALLRAGVVELRASPVAGTARGGFCWMGICQECLVDVDGVRTEACRTVVREGLAACAVTYD